jgi:hypothetical protein
MPSDAYWYGWQLAIKRANAYPVPEAAAMRYLAEQPQTLMQANRKRFLGRARDYLSSWWQRWRRRFDPQQQPPMAPPA